MQRLRQMLGFFAQGPSAVNNQSGILADILATMVEPEVPFRGA